MSIENTDLFKDILSERKNGTKRGHSLANKLNLEQKILSFDSRLSSGDKGCFSFSKKNTKTAVLMNQFTNSLMDFFPPSQSYAPKDFSMEMKDIFEDIIKRVTTGIIQPELEETYNELKSESLVEKQSIAQKVCATIILRTINRVIKRIAKHNIQNAFFSFLIYKGLLVQTTRSFILFNAFNFQCRADLLKSVTNEVFITSVKDMCVGIANDNYPQAVSQLTRNTTNPTSDTQSKINISTQTSSKHAAEELFIDIITKRIHTIVNNKYVEQRISLATYNTLIEKFHTDRIQNITKNFTGVTNTIFESFMENAIKKEINKILQTYINFIEDVYEVADTVYGKIVIKEFTSEIGGIRDSCLLCMKAVNAVYEESLITGMIKDIGYELLGSCDNLVKNSKDAAKTKVLMMDEITNKVCKALIKGSKVNEGFSNFVANKLIEKGINSTTENLSFNGIVVSSLTNSMFLIVCSGVIEKMSKEIYDDILLEKEMDDIENSPMVIQKATMLTEDNTTLKCKLCEALLSKMAMRLHKCCKLTPHFDNLEKLNKKLLKLLEMKDLPFPDIDNLYRDFRAVIMEAFKINWNVSALERLGLEPEKIAKNVETKEYYEQVVNFCKMLIDLIEEKIKILELKKEEPNEDESEDKEFIAYFPL